MTDQTHAYPKLDGGICTVCKQSLGADAHFITQAPDGEHSACRDWSKYDFPAHEDLVWLRRMFRRFSEQVADLHHAGTIVSQAERTWPRNAHQSLSQARTTIEKIKWRLRDLGRRLANLK